MKSQKTLHGIQIVMLESYSTLKNIFYEVLQ